MMRALISKELQALRTLAWCIAGLFLVSCAYLMFGDLPDAQTLKPEEWAEKAHEATFVVLLLFGTMIGAGLLVRENDEGTLRFLDGLPLSRVRLFFGKVVAALLIIALIPVLDVSSTLVFDGMSRASTDGPFPWRFVLVEAGLQMVAGAFILSMALVISFTRNRFTLIAGLVFWMFLWLRQIGVSEIQYIDPFSLLDPDLTSGAIVVPWPQVAAHFAATALLLGAALAGFCRMGDSAQFAAERMGRNPFLRGLGVGLRLFAPFIWIGALFYIVLQSDDFDLDAENTPVGEEAFGRRETRRYEFLFRKASEKDASPLMEVADGIHDEVAAFLEAPQPPTRFVVDLASPVISHAVGQTNWTKIRMPLNPDDSLAIQRRILGHETTHAFIEQLGGGRLSSHFASIRCLHEGLATHVETTLFAPGETAPQRRAVAGAWSRGKIPLALLVDNATLAKTRDPNLAYPLGAELAGAMIDAYGPGAPARFLRALGRPKAPPGLSGAELWRDALQHAGLNFERIAADYESRCGKLAEAEKAFVERLPKISAEVTLEGGKIVLHPDYAGTAPGDLVCFVEDNEPFSIGVKALRQREDGTFQLDRAAHLKSSLRYLLGWRTGETDLPVFEPWAEANL